MSPSTLRYLRGLEASVLGALLPVVNHYVQSWLGNPTAPLDWHLVEQSLIAAALTGAWAFIRSHFPILSAPPTQSANETPKD